MSDPKPMVLVHGGAHGAWCWAPTVERLRSPALAVDLPPRSVRGGPGRHVVVPELHTLTIDDFAASVVADLDAAGLDRVVLVGHSLAGVTISAVAAQIPERIAHLVYLSCSVPPEGGTVMGSLVGPTATVSRHAADDRAGDHGADVLPEGAVRWMFCNDMDEEQTRFVLDHLGLEVIGVTLEPVHRVDMPATIPATYVKLGRDQALVPALQDTFVENLRMSPGLEVEVIELDAGHDAMISAPDQVAALLDRIAGA